MAAESNDVFTLLFEFLSDMPTKQKQNVVLVDEPSG